MLRQKSTAADAGKEVEARALPDHSEIQRSIAIRIIQAVKRASNKFGSVEKATAMLDYRALVDNRKQVGCVHDTADGFPIAMLESG